MKKIAFMSLIASSVLMAGGYKIPETSTNAVALGAANIAHNQNNADAAYYNPAKMVFMSNENHIEADVTYIGLQKVKYNGTVGATGPYALESESENFLVPTLHYVSPVLGDNEARIGVSITAPGGLSKRWQTEPAKTSAQEFTLEIVEVNPTAAFKINDTLGFGVGFRIVRTSGVVKSSGTIGTPTPTTTASRDMTGDSVDFGYNLALAYKPTKALEIGVTYRSKVNLTIEGTANLATNFALVAPTTYNGASGVTVPLPASFNAAIAYTFASKTTIEFVYEKTMWSAYKELDFTYPTTLTNPVLSGAFDDPKAKNWKDTNTFRVGLTQELDTLTLMAGLVIDETPIPEETLGFELPDTNSVAVSLGGRYKINDKTDIGLSALYSMHDKRSVSSTVNDNGLNGEFTDGDILIVSVGLGYKF
ncbi:OmpP1/FadL family transporter [Sulfurimonas sp.]